MNTLKKLGVFCSKIFTIKKVAVKKTTTIQKISGKILEQKIPSFFNVFMFFSLSGHIEVQISQSED